MVLNKLELPCLFTFLENSKSIFPSSEFMCYYTIHPIFPSLLVFVTSFFITTTTIFSFVAFYLVRGDNLGIFYKFESPSTCENGYLNLS